MKRALLLALFLLPAVRAAGCQDYDVVLKIEQPPAVLAGAEFELDGERMVFSGGACLEAGFGVLRAARIVYDRHQRLLLASDVAGEISGWQVKAPRLRGEGERLELTSPRFERGDAVVTAARAESENGGLQLENLQARTPRYRFRAERGWIKDDVFKASGVWSTPCKCGSAIEISAGEAEFAFAAGRLYLRRASFRLYGLELARPPEVLVEPEKEMRLEFPLRLSYGSGWNFGVENLPLPLEGEAFGRWSTHLTVLAAGVGGPLYAGKTESLRLALDYRQGSERFYFGLKPVRKWDGAAWSYWLEPSASLVSGPLRFGLGWSAAAQSDTAYFMLTTRETLGRLTAAPFFRLSREEAHAGLAAGLGGELSLASLTAGDWRLELRAPFMGAAYPDAAPYGWGGLRFEAASGRLFSLQAGGYLAAGTPRYAYEARGNRLRLAFKLGDQPWLSGAYGLNERYDLAAGAVSRVDTSYELGAGWRELGASWSLWRYDQPAGGLVEAGERWRLWWRPPGGELTLEWNRRWDGGWNPTRSELWLAYRPPLPDCAGGWSLAPSLGYDLLGGGVSRAGLTLRLNDCCFTWTLGYQGVFNAAAAGGPAGSDVTFGVSIR